MINQSGHRSGSIKFLILFFVVVMQACLGGTYSWSVYDTIFINQYHIPAGLSSAPFNIFYIVFPLTMLFASLLTKRLGYQRSAILGGLLFGGGWMFASLGDNNFYMTLVGVGVLGGMGVGIAYLIPIAVGVAWFPQHRGLVTGMAVGGFAGGAALVSQLSQYLIDTGITPFALLGFMGAGYVVLGCVAGAFMLHPDPDGSHNAANTLPVKTLLKTPVFQALFIAMTVGIAAGFFMNSKLALLSSDFGVELILSAVAIFAIFNAIGRLTWGWISDHMNPSQTLKVNLGLQALVVIASPILLKSDAGAALLAGITGFNYGGVLVLYASTVGHFWGNDAIKSVYPWLMLSNISGALINAALGIIYSDFGLMLPAGIILILIILSLWVLQRSLNKAPEEAQVQPVPV